MKTRLLGIALALAALTAALWISAAAPAWAQQQTISRASYPYNLVTKEVIACNAGVSPCAVAAASVVVLNPNYSRSTAAICNSGTVTIYCCYHVSTCAGAAAYDVALKAATGANDGSGTCLVIGGNSGRIWAGGITCAGAAGGAVSAVGY